MALGRGLMLMPLLASHETHSALRYASSSIHLQLHAFMQIVPWIGITHGSLRDLAAFTLLTTVALYCYLLSVLVDPGAVPRGYEHDPEDVTAMYIQVLPTLFFLLLSDIPATCKQAVPKPDFF